MCTDYFISMIEFTRQLKQPLSESFVNRLFLKENAYVKKCEHWFFILSNYTYCIQQKRTLSIFRFEFDYSYTRTLRNWERSEHWTVFATKLPLCENQVTYRDCNVTNWKYVGQVLTKCLSLSNYIILSSTVPFKEESSQDASGINQRSYQTGLL